MGRAHETAEQYAARAAAFAANKARVGGGAGPRSLLSARCQRAGGCSRRPAARVPRQAQRAHPAHRPPARRHPQILAHNAAAAAGGPGAPAHTLRINRFADVPRDEFERVMLPNKWAADRGLLRDAKVGGGGGPGPRVGSAVRGWRWWWPAQASSPRSNRPPPCLTPRRLATPAPARPPPAAPAAAGNLPEDPEPRRDPGPPGLARHAR
jgi:hypothetical protein